MSQAKIGVRTSECQGCRGSRLLAQFWRRQRCSVTSPGPQSSTRSILAFQAPNRLAKPCKSSTRPHTKQVWIRPHMAAATSSTLNPKSQFLNPEPYTLHSAQGAIRGHFPAGAGVLELWALHAVWGHGLAKFAKVSLCLSLSLCMYVCMHACMHAGRQAGRQACMYVCM